MRRRFAFLSLHPDEDHVAGMLSEWLTDRHPEHIHVAVLLSELNAKLNSRDYAIGPSYFMRDWIYEDDNGIAEVWATDILPLLEEHHAGEGIDIGRRYELRSLLASVTRAEDVFDEVEDDASPNTD